MPILKAFLAVELSGSDESQSVEFRQNYENLKQNLDHFKLKPMDEQLNTLTLYRTIRLLLDKEELDRLFGGTVSSLSQPQWFNLSAASVFSSMSKFMVYCNIEMIRIMT